MGFPSPALDYEEGRISLDSLLDIRHAAVYIMRFKGSALNTFDSEDVVLVIDSSKSPENGALVVFDVSGEYRVRRVYYRGENVAVTDPDGSNPQTYDLEKIENPEYSLVFGVVTAVVALQ